MDFRVVHQLEYRGIISVVGAQKLVRPDDSTRANLTRPWRMNLEF